MKPCGDRNVEGRLRPVHAAEVPRLVEMDAGVAHLVRRVRPGERAAPRTFRAAGAGAVLLPVQPQHLLGGLHAHDAGHDHVHDGLDLLLVEQVHRLALVLTVGRLDVRVEVHLELEAGAADELAVVQLDEQALEVHRVRRVEVVEEELERLVLVALELQPVVEDPGEDVAGGLLA